MDTANSSQDVNPINRDLSIVFGLGFAIAIAIVTIGIMLVNYL